MMVAVLIALAQCWAPDGGIIAASGVDPPDGVGVTLLSRLFPTNGDADLEVDTTNTRTHGYLLKLSNNGVTKGSVSAEGSAVFPWVTATEALMARTFYSVGAAGFYFGSGRSAGDTSADLMLVTADGRAGPMAEGRAGGYPGTVAWRLNSDGSIGAGRQGGEGAFVDYSGVADPQGNAGPPSLTCHPGSNPNCYLFNACKMSNNGFHGCQTIGNIAYRDAGTGLMFQVVSREARYGAPNADGQGQDTVTTISDLGDLKLWGGTVNPYVAGDLPACSNASDDGRSGPHTGAIAWSVSHGALMVCDNYGEWRQLATVAP